VWLGSAGRAASRPKTYVGLAVFERDQVDDFAHEDHLVFLETRAPGHLRFSRDFGGEAGLASAVGSLGAVAGAWAVGGGGGGSGAAFEGDFWAEPA